MKKKKREREGERVGEMCKTSLMNELIVNKYQSTKGILAITMYWALETFIHMIIFISEYIVFLKRNSKQLDLLKIINKTQ